MDSEIHWSLVFPLYNEAPNIERVFPPLIELVEAEAKTYELVLVDNGSRDDTGRRIDELGRRHDCIRKVTVAENQGYGWGVLSGLARARGEKLAFLAGDGQIKPEDVLRVCHTLDDNPDALAKVYRVTRHDGPLRRIITRIYNWLFWLMFGGRTRDANGTPKAFSRDLMDRLDLRSRDWFLDAEVMIKAIHLDVPIIEVPAEFLPRPGGSSNVRASSLVEFLVNMVRFRFGKEFAQWKRRA